MATVIGRKTGKRDYLQVVKLDDDTTVNVVTRFTGPGLAADSEIETPRELTTEEQDAALEAAAVHDVQSGPEIRRPARFPALYRF